METENDNKKVKDKHPPQWGKEKENLLPKKGISISSRLDKQNQIVKIDEQYDKIKNQKDFIW